MPTTSGPGAKAYASASCSNKSSTSILGVTASTTAKAGNVRNSDSDSSRYEAYASSSALGTYDCYRRGEASKRYLTLLGSPTTRTVVDVNRSCT